MPKDHILIVDDEEHIRQALAMILLDNGYRVTLARDGLEALEVTQRAARDGGEAVALLLMDVHMPHMSGIGLLDALRDRGLYPPVVAITGYGDRRTVEELRARGCDCCLDKPAAPGDIVARIEETLSLSRAQHSNT